VVAVNAEILPKGDQLSRRSRYSYHKTRAVDRATAGVHGLSNLRVDIGHLTKELLRDKRETVGRLDRPLEGNRRVRHLERPVVRPGDVHDSSALHAKFAQYVRRRSRLSVRSALIHPRRGVRG